MRELQAYYQVVIAAARLAVGLPAYLQHLREIGGGAFVDQELTRIGPGLLDDGGRLGPDELGAAGAEAPIAAQRQFVGPAVERTIAALHRLNAQPIADDERTDICGGKKRR